MTYVIRPATIDEFQTAVDWATQEGWNPGLKDLAAFHATDPNGFLMGWLDGKPVASISVVRYGDEFGFLGFYIVHPDHRGAGYGMDIWNAGMEYLKGRVVGLDGVADQQDNYRQSGFVLAGRNVRYTGVPTGTRRAVMAKPALNADLDAICKYDQAFYPASRTTFLKAWLGSDRLTKVVRVGGKIAGYGCVRACHSGYKIGPLFANDPDTARDIFAALIAELPEGAVVSFDVPEANTAAVELAVNTGLVPSFETARMYRGTAPELRIAKIFGITSFELG